MLDWFIWKGERSYLDTSVYSSVNDPYAVHALSMPIITRMDERISSVRIPGRSGDLIFSEGEEVYSSLPISIPCVIDDPSELDGSLSPIYHKRIANISSWLKGRGTIEFANRPGGFYKGRIINQIAFGKILRDNPHRSFSVNWTCDPFFYLTAGTIPTSVSLQTRSEGSVLFENVGNVRSHPKIDISFNTAVRTSGTELTLQFGQEETFTVTMPTGIDHLIIDSEEMLIYSTNPGTSDKTLRGTFIDTMDWPYFGEGETVLSWSCSDNFERNGTFLNVYPNWRVI